MKIIKLPQGKRAADNVDCISIDQLADGSFTLMGSALINCGDSDEVESVSLVELPPYHTYQEAEDAGLAWAAEQCVDTVYISSQKTS